MNAVSDSVTIVRRWHRTFPGYEDQVRRARQFVTASLPHGPELDAARLIVSELATNAVRHSWSGAPGGRFCVSVHVDREGLWLSVSDDGGPDQPEVQKADEGQEHGRGLNLIDHLAASWGVDGDEHSRTVWALVRVASQRG